MLHDRSGFILSDDGKTWTMGPARSRSRLKNRVYLSGPLRLGEYYFPARTISRVLPCFHS